MRTSALVAVHSPMASNTLATCTGKDKDGDPCPCLRMVEDLDQEAGTRKVCVYCGHWPSCHPMPVSSAPSSVADIFSKYRTPLVAAKLKSSTVSAEDAIRETNAGLRREKKADQSVTKGKNSAQKPKVSCIASKATPRHIKSFTGCKNGQGS